jgi:ABC-2 type transport system permease protein
MSAYLSTVSGSRDFENQTYEFFFTSPIKRFSYFFGRFLGSYIIMLIISISVLIGMMIGEFAPWHPKYELNPFNITSYINAFYY